jgi:predicted RNase H-like HicB family nuclease
VATGKTPQEAKSLIKEALEFHLEGLKEDGMPTPQPAALGEYVAI